MSAITPVMYPGCLGDQYTGLGPKTLVPKKHFQVFFFQLYFIKKYVDAVSMISQSIYLFRNSLEDKNA